MNPIVFDYLDRYIGQYPLDALKQKILSKGYSKQEIEEAIGLLEKRGRFKKELPKEEPREEMRERIAEKFREEKPESLRGFSASENFPENSFNKNKKPIFPLIAGICGILGIINIAACVYFWNFNEFYNQALIGLSALFFIIFSLGFFVLGKRYNQKLVKISSILFVLVFGLAAGLLIFLDLAGIAFSEFNVIPRLFGDLMIWAIIAVFILVLFIVSNISLGVGLVKLKDELKSAKLAGTLLIISGATLIIGVGALIWIFAYIFEIIILFRAK